MKLLIFSDLHGSLNAAKIIEFLNNEENPDYIFLLGDLNYNGARNPVPEDYNPKEVTEILNKLKDKILAVKGNCDSEVDEMVYEFPLPIINGLKLENTKFIMTHGHKEKYMALDLMENEVFLYGHTHIPEFKKSKHGGLIINPGSMTFPKGKFSKTFVICRDNEYFLVEFSDDNGKFKKLNEYKLGD